MMSDLWFLSGFFSATLLYALRWLYRKYRQKKRILQMLRYLERAACGEECLLLPVEDEFSLLQDEISKTVSELRIAREISQIERQHLADNLADIAHQLKTPLTSMSLMTQLLEQCGVDGQEDYLQRMSDQLARLDWLTSSLLTMSRLDAGVIEFVKVPVPFEVLVERASEPMKQMMVERNQHLLVSGEETCIFCDLHWTSEAVLNVLKNCSEHTPSGGEIKIIHTATPLYTQLIMEDNGVGFDKDEIPHLFKRFYRGKHAKKDSIGIGLALARAMVEGQGGILYAENCKNSGARFIMRIYEYYGKRSVK